MDEKFFNCQKEEYFNAYIILSKIKIDQFMWVRCGWTKTYLLKLMHPWIGNHSLEFILMKLQHLKCYCDFYIDRYSCHSTKNSCATIKLIMTAKRKIYLLCILCKFILLVSFSFNKYFNCNVALFLPKKNSLHMYMSIKNFFVVRNVGSVHFRNTSKEG